MVIGPRRRRQGSKRVAPEGTKRRPPSDVAGRVVPPRAGCRHNDADPPGCTAHGGTPRARPAGAQQGVAFVCHRHRNDLHVAANCCQNLVKKYKLTHSILYSILNSILDSNSIVYSILFSTFYYIEYPIFYPIFYSIIGTIFYSIFYFIFYYIFYSRFYSIFYFLFYSMFYSIFCSIFYSIFYSMF